MTDEMDIKIKLLRENAQIPEYRTDGAAGADITACLDGAVIIPPGGVAAIPSGFAAEIPDGYAGFVFARSGMAAKHGLAPANMVGVVDSDYRGEVVVALRNFGSESQEIEPGERIAQFVVMPVARASFTVTEELAATVRNGGGFGSTGR